MNENPQLKKTAKILAALAIVFTVGGLGGVYFQQYVLPRIRTNSALSRIDFFKKATENITVINKTEQITVKEDDSINSLVRQPTATVVKIVSTPNLVKSESEKGKLPVKTEGRGATGVIATSDGMIMTYRSALLEKDSSYTVFLHDGSGFAADLVGVDEFTNLAFLKIETSNLPVINFADPADVLPGSKLVAIGTDAKSGEAKYATGILSGISKTLNLGGLALSSSEKLEGVFRTDFELGSEYLGGPVIGYGGELVGINGAVTLDNQIVSFQIPVNVVKNSLDLAVRGELGQRAFLGAYYVPLTKEYASAHSLAQDRGALIFSPSGKQGLALIAGSPAEKAGIKLGDIVSAINSAEVNLDNPLANLLSQYKKGDRVELAVLRAGKELKLAVQL